MIRPTVYAVVAGLVLVLWLCWTWMLVLGRMFADLEGEWRGWGDILLNPYLIGPWVLLGLAFATLGLLYRHSLRQ